MANCRIPNDTLEAKDQLRVNFKAIDIDHTEWENLAAGRSTWVVFFFILPGVTQDNSSIFLAVFYPVGKKEWLDICLGYTG